MAKIKVADENFDIAGGDQEFKDSQSFKPDFIGSENEPSNKSFKKFWLWLFGIIVLVVAVWFVYSWQIGAGFLFGSDNKYQAIFLDNNQVYFGKLSREKSDYAVLRDIYYLRLNQALQPPASTAQIPDINLVKLGTELHGPEDEMRINREHILFIENLKEDGQVVKAIKSFQEFQAKQGQ
jgi:hypothetical protein